MLGITYSNREFSQSDPSRKRLLWISDAVFKTHVNIGDGHFQIFYDICNELFDE